jgi:hypothetical protein
MSADVPKSNARAEINLSNRPRCRSNSRVGLLQAPGQVSGAVLVANLVTDHRSGNVALILDA